MRIRRSQYGTTVWASAHDTYQWAHKAGAAWPCSTLSDNRIMVTLDASGDVVDFTLNGRDGDVDSHELNAFLADVLAREVTP